MTWILFFTFSIFSGLYIPFLPFRRHLLLFPSIRCESLLTLLLLLGLYFSFFAAQSFLNALFNLVYSSFWKLTPISLFARPGSAMDGLLSIKICSFLSRFRISLTNSSWDVEQFLLRSTSLRLLIMSGISLFSINLLRLIFLHALLVELNLSFQTGALEWFYKITQVASFDSRQGAP